MKRALAVIALAATLYLLPIAGKSVISHVPDKDRLKRNPLASDGQAPAAGRKLFEDHCAQCHGSSAQGGKRAPELVGGEMELATPGEIFWVVTNGVVRHGMPSWSKLPEAQRWQIVTFLQSLNASKGTAARESTIKP